MWSIEYPYDNFPEIMEKIAFDSSKLLNHIPGIVALTNKRFLGTKVASKFVPPAFSLPRDDEKFNKFSSQNPNAKFVVKNSSNRGVRLATKKDFEELRNASGGAEKDSRFVQVFVDDLFLVEGRAFDMGIYVLLTSLDPLTIYRFKSECLFRFCPEPYHPFNASNSRQYVIDDSKLFLWDLPAFAQQTSFFSHLEIFENYVKSRGMDVGDLRRQLDDAIISTVLKQHAFMLQFFRAQCERLACRNENFFELLRFDFVIRSDGRVQLMEVNLSPNLTPSDTASERNANMHEQVVYNVLRLIGVEAFAVFQRDLGNSPMTSRLENLAVDIENCSECAGKCSEFHCSHCLACMPKEFHEVLHKTHREHQRRGEFKRIFPSSVHKTNERLSEQTKLLSRWLEKKCADDDDWC